MGSALVIVGLALVLAVQIAIHLRIAGIPARVATLRLTATWQLVILPAEPVY